MTLVLRGITPDAMGWALGRALYEQTAALFHEKVPWDKTHPHSRLWHARRAQWYLDHCDRGPGQWPTPTHLVTAQVLWDATEYPGVLPTWESYTLAEQNTLVEQATDALDTARSHHDTPTPEGA